MSSADNEGTFYVVVRIREGTRGDAGNLRKEIHRFFQDRPRIAGADIIIGNDRQLSFYGTDESSEFNLIDTFVTRYFERARAIVEQRRQDRLGS